MTFKKSPSPLNSVSSSENYCCATTLLEKILMLVIILNVLTITKCLGQDPALPATNLGFTGVLDGVAGPPGLVYVNYTQIYQLWQVNNEFGNAQRTNMKINVLLSLHQIILQSNTRIIGGNLAFTLILPIVKISAINRDGPSPSINSGPFGDLTVGPALLWKNKLFLGKPFSHRLEFDLTLPTGSFGKQYNINSSSHLYVYSLYHTFTYSVSRWLTVSVHNQFNYNSCILGSEIKPGAFYNGNYAISYPISKLLRAEITGYYLTQLNQDAFNGNRRYYLEKYNVTNTKEKLAALGPGINFSNSSGLSIEGKVFFETEATNRAQGYRPTIILAIPLH
ncbi:hypothetical protein ABIB62_004447 [Mucilaginibacter sp. UYP25]|uniref:SphA family protein n=1 Tax=unclassified Mucilaginibacter TaxID=2617802 RepID=UPI003397C260